MNINHNIVQKEVTSSMRVANPYTPGAGNMPDYLAGRENTLKAAKQILQAESMGYPQQPVIYYGLRGVGKTVLLNAVEESIETLPIAFEHMEVSEENGDFLTKITGACTKILHTLSLSNAAKDFIASAVNLLRALQISWNPEEKTVSVDLSGEIPPVTGNLSSDLTDLFVQLGKIAKKSNMAICFFIDEVQYLSSKEAEALINALHRVNQLRYPVIVFGAGLPKVLKEFEEAKSYSERLFQFIEIDKLDDHAAREAICIPAERQNVSYSEQAVEEILRITEGYPYFIQELCSAAWNATTGDRIEEEDIARAAEKFYQKMDQGFFKSRFDRCSKREQEFIFAMVRCGELPCTIANVAAHMNLSAKKVATYRAQLINKGIIYATGYGEVDFTVPQFDAYLKRIAPERTR